MIKLIVILGIIIFYVVVGLFIARWTYADCVKYNNRLKSVFKYPTFQDSEIATISVVLWPLAVLVLATLPIIKFITSKGNKIRAEVLECKNARTFWELKKSEGTNAEKEAARIWLEEHS